MKHLLAATACILTLAVTACAQTTTNAALRQDSVVVTNEQDLVGIEFARTNHVEKLYSPGSSTTWVDGEGNKYTVVPTVTFTFSDDFSDYLGNKPAESSYTLQYGQYIVEGSEAMYRWTFSYNEQGIKILKRNLFDYDNWGATTNQYVLDSSDGGVGVALIATGSATNLVDSFTNRFSAAGGVLSGNIEIRYPYGAIKAQDVGGNPSFLSLNDFGTEFFGGYPIDPAVYNVGVGVGKGCDSGYVLDIGGRTRVNGDLEVTNNIAAKSITLDGAPIQEAVTNIVAYRAPFTTYTNLTGSITLTNNLEAPISISGTGSISVAFSGLVVPYPVYFTAQGFSSITFPAGSYLVGGGMWQTNRVNHFIVWQHSTNLFINPLLSTEIPE